MKGSHFEIAIRPCSPEETAQIAAALKEQSIPHKAEPKIVRHYAAGGESVAAAILYVAVPVFLGMAGPIANIILEIIKRSRSVKISLHGEIEVAQAQDLPAAVKAFEALKQADTGKATKPRAAKKKGR